MLLLLYMFNPTVTALRSIPLASELAKVKKRLGCENTSLASLSEASLVFASDRLKAIIAELGEQAAPVNPKQRLTETPQAITLVDGSLVSALPNLIQASILKQNAGNYCRAKAKIPVASIRKLSLRLIAHAEQQSPGGSMRSVFDAPSIRLSFGSLRPRRAILRFTERR